MAYQVLQPFTDSETGKVYQPGDSYPANKKKERIASLLSADINDHPNFLRPLLKTIEDEQSDDGVDETNQPAEDED